MLKKMLHLDNKAYDNITADDVDAVSATKVTGTFDLTDADDDTYDVCVKDSLGTVECGLSFDITTNEVGSIDISSNPSGASIYIDGTLKGTTPDTVDDLLVGSHKIVLKKSGDQDWGKMVTVEADDTVDVEANLYAVATAATPVPTTNPTTIPRTSRTTVKSTIKVPTTWADIPTTAASPGGFRDHSWSSRMVFCLCVRAGNFFISLYPAPIFPLSPVYRSRVSGLTGNILKTRWFIPVT